MSRFNEEDVVFEYIAIESKETLWKRFVSELELGGRQHYLMDNEQSKFFRNAMNVQGMPEHFLIDKTGNIVDRGDHLGPRKKVNRGKNFGTFKVIRLWGHQNIPLLSSIDKNNKH